jgi:hypothetical protein
VHDVGGGNQNARRRIDRHNQLIVDGKQAQDNVRDRLAGASRSPSASRAELKESGASI